MPTQTLRAAKQMIGLDRLGGAAGPASSLKHLAVAGGTWTVAGMILTSLMRLGGNLILTRWLAQEAFGLMALVSVVLMALQMLSDIGVEAAVVQSSRDDPDYLNTAWTLKLLREWVLFLAACALAWPMAAFYREPALLYLIPVVGLGAGFSGFESTTLISLRRNLHIGTLTSIGIIRQFLGTGMTVAWAFFWPSVWALVIGSLIGNLVGVALSYCLPRDFKHRLRLDRQAIRHMYGFSRWIFLSTMLTLVSLHADRLFLGKLTSMEFLGIYAIALVFAMIIHDMTIRLVHTVMFPSLSRVHRESPDRVGGIYYRFRFWLDMLIQPAAGFLVVAGPWFIALLYPPQWQAAGWILQILCIRSAMMGVLAPCETCLFSRGHTYYGFLQNLSRVIWMCAGIPLGYYLGGVPGIIWAIGLSELPSLVVLWTGFSRHGLLRLDRELWAVICFAGGCGLGLATLWLW